MLRRALLTVLPTLLALVFLSGTPGAGIAGADSGASTWNAAPNPAAVRLLTSRGTLTEDDAGGAASQSADEDDVPDSRIVRLVTSIAWPTIPWAAIVRVGDKIGLSHPPRAAPSRAPPFA
jgi:hypothetical protein